MKSALKDWKHAKIFRDFAIVFIIAIFLFFLGSTLNFFEILIEFSQRHEEWQIDKFFTLGIVLVFAFIILSLLRWGELRHEIIEHKRAEEQIKLNEVRLQSLYNISQYKAKELGDLLDYVLNEAIQLTGSKIGWFGFYQEENKTLRITNWSKKVMKDCKITEKKLVLSIENAGIWAEGISRRMPFIINDYQDSNLHKKGCPVGHPKLIRFLTIPLLLQDMIVAAMAVANKEKDYDETDVRQLTLLMNSVLKMVEQKRSEEALQRSEEEARRLAQENAIVAEIGQIISSTLNIDDIYESFAEEVRKLIPFDRIAVIRVNNNDNTITSIYAAGIDVIGRFKGNVTPLVGTFSEEIIRTRTSRLLQKDDLKNIVERFPTLSPFVQAGIQSSMAIPLILKDEVFGILQIQSTKPNVYSERDLILAEKVCNQIAAAIANAQLFTEQKQIEEALQKSEKEAKRLAQENAIMAEIGRIITSTLNIEEVYERFSEEVRKLIPFDRIAIELFNPKDNIITIAYAIGEDGPERRAEGTIPLIGSASGECIRTRSSLLIQPDNIDEIISLFPTLSPLIQAGIRSMILVPLISKDQVIGVLLLLSVKQNAYTERDLRLAEKVGNQIAGAIVNAQLFKEQKQAEEALQKSEKEAKRLAQENAIMAEIGRIITSTLNIEEVYERFSEEVRKLIPFDIVAIGHSKDNIMTISYAAGMDIPGKRIGGTIPLIGSASGECIRTRSSLLIQPDNIDEIISLFPTLSPVIQAGIRSMILVPLISKDQVIGVLLLLSVKQNAYTERDLGLAEKVGNQIAGAIVNAQLFTEQKQAEEALQKSEKEAKRLAQENAIMAEIGRIITSTLNIEEVYERFSEEVRKLIPFDRIGIELFNPKDNMITIAYVIGDDVPGRRAGDTIPLISSASGECIRTRSSVLLQGNPIDNVASRFPALLPAFEAGVRSMMFVPLISKDQVIGALFLRTTQPNFYTEKDLRLAEKVSNQIAGAIVNAQLFTEHKQSEEALRKSEERLKDLYDNAPVGYHEFYTGGRITRVNRTELEMLGYTEEEVLGKYAWDFIVEKVSPELVREKLDALPLPGRTIERTFRRKDGTTFPALIHERFIRDDEGQIMGFRSAIQDITELKRAEDRMNTLQEQLRQSQKMEAIGRLAGGISHDFNNLLTVIKGYSQLALLDLKEGDPLKGNVEEIQKASQRATDLTRQLLAFSRRQILEVKVFDLNSVVRDLDKMLQRIIGEDIELVYILSDDLGKIKTDPTQIEQVILNLAVNARDAMPSGGKLTIETANVVLNETYTRSHVDVKPDHYVMLSVSDSGCGMSQEVKEHIFEPFFTTKEKGKGTGLGLSTVYGIVKQSGGDIWFYSELGRGTVFKIYLPRMDETPKEGKEKDAEKGFPIGNETILVVEDELSVRGLAFRVLQRQGYMVLEASNGDEALRLVQEHPEEKIHLLLTDVVMPGMSGSELAERLRSFHAEVKVLYMSGYTDNSIVQHGILEPGIDFIQKPFSPEVLARRVREVLDNNQNKRMN